MVKHFVCAAFIGVFFTCNVFASLAADPWPSRPVSIVVPYVAGGQTDVIARMLAGKLRAEFGQAFIVDNRGGASGNIAAMYSAKAGPDGYTLFLATSTHIVNMSLFRSAVDMTREFVPVSLVASIPSVLVVNHSLPVNDVAGFINYIRDPKNNVNCASGGPGSSPHLAAVLFAKLAGGHLTDVPYKGSAPGIIDLLGGHIQAMFHPLGDGLPHIKAGKLKALGTTTKTRSALLPEVPAIAEVLPKYEHVIWNGIFVPASTPSAIVMRLNTAIVNVMRQPDTEKLLAAQGSAPAASAGLDMKEFVRHEVQRWHRVVQMSGLTME